MPLRLAAIAFLNPAPLLYDFEHEPRASELRERYTLHYTSPARCAQQLLQNEADLGLIPIAALTAELAVAPGCAIASLHRVRSILLLVKNPQSLSRNDALRQVRTLATDTASRSSTAYAAVLFQHFAKQQPALQEHAAEPLPMLSRCDAALLIGDPALLAREQRAEIDARAGVPLLWLDVAELWREATGLPWVAAVWAVRPEALVPSAAEGVTAGQLIGDLVASRDAGLRHTEDLVHEWAPRIQVPSQTIHKYLTENIHYQLDPDCLQAVDRFRQLAFDAGVLPPLPALRIL